MFSKPSLASLWNRACLILFLSLETISQYTEYWFDGYSLKLVRIQLVLVCLILCVHDATKADPLPKTRPGRIHLVHEILKLLGPFSLSNAERQKFPCFINKKHIRNTKTGKTV